MSDESSFPELSPEIAEYFSEWESSVEIYCRGTVVDPVTGSLYEDYQTEHLQRALKALVPVPAGQTNDAFVQAVKENARRLQNNCLASKAVSQDWLDIAQFHLGEVCDIRDGRSRIPSSRPAEDSTPDTTARYAAVTFDIDD